MLIWIVWHFCRVYRYHCTRSVHLYLHLHLHSRNPGEWTNINIVCLLLLRLVLTCLRPPLFFLLDLVRLGTKATAGALNRAFEALFGSDVKHRCCTRFSAVVVSTMDHDILGPTLTEPQHCNLFRFTRSIRDIEFIVGWYSPNLNSSDCQWQLMALLLCTLTASCIPSCTKNLLFTYLNLSLILFYTLTQYILFCFIDCWVDWIVLQLFCPHAHHRRDSCR